jgi:hypothetical protein
MTEYIIAKSRKPLNILCVFNLSTLFAKISLQTWGTDQFQDWSEIIDSAYTRDEINTMDPMWNEGFLFRVRNFELSVYQREKICFVLEFT